MSWRRSSSGSYDCCISYYEALEAWDERQELDPLVNFLREQAVKIWEKQLRRAEKKKDV